MTRMTAQYRREAGSRETAGPMRTRDPVALVIFGASGDLAQRKLIPALYHLHSAGYLPERYAVIGFSRSEMSDQAYRTKMHAALQEQLKGERIAPDHPLLQSLHYCAGNNDDPASFRRLAERLAVLDRERNLAGNRLFYLSVAPDFFSVIINQLEAAGLVRDPHEPSWSRVIIEKPFGRDLESARELSRQVTAVLDESQIYRIDHYLGKETVQNILSFRFGNAIFEPLFNRKYISNVQLTVAEPLGMEGKRGHYYDTAGALRDMVQNHMLQLLCLTAMEPPSALEATSIRDEKVKLLRAILPYKLEEVAAHTVRAQYGPGELKGEPVRGYRQEEGVQPDSQTESYTAIRLFIDNWRWAGVPFYLRHGKRLVKKATEIAIEFKRPPLHLFKQNESSDYCLLTDRPATNQLVLRIQPEEGIRLAIACKMPGMRIQLEEVDMDFTYREAFTTRSPEAYERLLLDALRGDPSLFTRSDEVEYAWRFVHSILAGWSGPQAPAMASYQPFSEGPAEANALVQDASVRWRKIMEM